jgi:hypothetical protein
MYYIPDTNIWVDVTQGKISCADLSSKTGIRVVVAPFMIVELMRATVRSRGKYFLGDQTMFQCMAQFDILELTKVFVYKTLWNISEGGTSKVDANTYKILLDMMNKSTSFEKFIAKTESPGSVWKRVSEWDSIHEGVIDKELGALGKIADSASLKSLGVHMSRLYGVGGLLPDPDHFEQKFSAAMEYLRVSAVKLRRGANLAKNDRGMYIDFQILFYLADPDAVIVSNEGFGEITKSSQRNRIISLAEFMKL